jgi:methyltransferase (TIGR00027 family)
MMRDDPQYAQSVSAASSDLCAEFVEASMSAAVVRNLRRPCARWLTRLVERMTIPGILRHYALRKKRISELVHDALTSGITQVVVLGGGFDPLGILLHREYPDVGIWELDHPATQKIKAEVSRIGSGRFHFISVDLAGGGLDTIPLPENGFLVAERTIWIAEGLLMYFHPDAVRNLFQHAAGMSAPGSHFIFTCMKGAPGAPIRFERQSKTVDWWLRGKSEPFRWAATPATVPDQIAPWRISRIFDEGDLRRLNLLPAATPLAAGEFICLSEIA